MALIECPECQKNMSDTLEACPHCGFKVVKVAAPVKPTGNNTICSGCGQQYYKGAGKCPYCFTKNVSRVKSTSSTTSEPFIIDKLINNIVGNIKKHPKRLIIGAIIIIAVVGLYAGSIKMYSSNPNKSASEELVNNLNETITSVDNLLGKGLLGDAFSRAKSGIDGDNISEDNYFKINGVTDENNVKYFGGNYNKKKQELTLLLEQIKLASIAVDDLKDYDPSKVTDIRVQKAFPLAVEKAKKDRDNAKSASTSSGSSGEINAGVRYNNTQIVITNNDSRTWTNIRIKINDDYKMNIGSMRSGETKTIRMSECANSSGDRFNPYAKKFQNIYIGSDSGYFYSSTN